MSFNLGKSGVFSFSDELLMIVDQIRNRLDHVRLSQMVFKKTENLYSEDDGLRIISRF